MKIRDVRSLYMRCLAAMVLAVAVSFPSGGAAQVSPLAPKPEEFLFASTSGAKKWERLVERYRDRGSAEPLARALFPQDLIPNAEMDLVRAVHRFTRARPYISDAELYGVPDYWATPQEYMARGGDCEDAAIFSYFVLREMGWRSDDLLIVVAQVEKSSIHAFLLVRLTDGWRSLDILSPQIQSAYPSNMRLLYAINEEHLAFPRMRRTP
jgi:predicted transglutaminase-like cysteine proteinase